MTSLKEMFLFLMDPWIFLARTLLYIPAAIYSILSSDDWTALLSWPRFQSVWFGKFWAWAGPGVRKTGERRVLPLLEGRVRAGKFHDEAVIPPVSGAVLEVGAGSGMWVDVFSQVNAPAATSHAAGAKASGDVRTRVPVGGVAHNGVTKVYGVEPNAGSHAELRWRAQQAGLEGVYEIVPVGIESLGDSELWDGRIEEESLDCIVSILCLCSIPEPDKNIPELYKYLKKGGRWYVYEHVKTKSCLVMKIYQRFLNIFWPVALGGCQLCRDTETSLRRAGAWADVDLVQPLEEPWYHSLPHVYGTLTK